MHRQNIARGESMQISWTGRALSLRNATTYSNLCRYFMLRVWRSFIPSTFCNPLMNSDCGMRERKKIGRLTWGWTLRVICNWMGGCMQFLSRRFSVVNLPQITIKLNCFYRKNIFPCHWGCLEVKLQNDLVVETGNIVLHSSIVSVLANLTW